jgi:hypothetical protein
MVIALIVLLSGFPLFLLLAPVKTRQAVRLVALHHTASPETAAPAPSQSPEPCLHEFELPLRSEAHRNG